MCSQTVRKMKNELKSIDFWKAVLSEFVGTFILMSVQAALPLNWPGSGSSPVRIALGMGSVVTTLMESLGHIGGAHVNPAVSIGMLFVLKITPLRAILYIIAQCGGALAGAGFIYGVTAEEARGNLSATTVSPLITPIQGFFVELFLTFFLVFTISGATDDRRNPVMPSTAVGMALITSVLTGIDYTGASLNPARSLGPAVVMGIWDDHWVYWAGPVAGAVIATTFYHFFLAYKRLPADGAENCYELGPDPPVGETRRVLKSLLESLPADGARTVNSGKKRHENMLLEH